MSTARAPVGLLTVDQVAELLRFSTWTVEVLIRSGELKRFALSDRDVGRKGTGRRSYRIHPDDLAAFVDFRRRAGTPRAETPAPAAASSRVVLPMATGTDGKCWVRRPKRRR